MKHSHTTIDSPDTSHGCVLSGFSVALNAVTSLGERKRVGLVPTAHEKPAFACSRKSFIDFVSGVGFGYFYTLRKISDAVCSLTRCLRWRMVTATSC
jgi:hypothetical protein